MSKLCFGIELFIIRDRKKIGIIEIIIAFFTVILKSIRTIRSITTICFLVDEFNPQGKNICENQINTCNPTFSMFGSKHHFVS